MITDITYPDASVSIKIYFLGSNVTNIGAVVKRRLSVLKASLASALIANCNPFLMSLVSGAAILKYPSMNCR